MASGSTVQALPQVQKANAVISSGGGARLHNGSMVQARVIASLGGGAYTVSVAGQQVAVRSQVPLTVGNAFTAQIQLRGGEIALVLQRGTETPPAPPQSTVQTLLATLGLPQSAESARLLLFAEELGIKIKPEQLKKALAVAKCFAGSEDDAAALSVLLDDKGLASGADAVQAVFAGGGNGSGGQNTHNTRRDDKRKKRDADEEAANGESEASADTEMQHSAERAFATASVPASAAPAVADVGSVASADGIALHFAALALSVVAATAPTSLSPQEAADAIMAAPRAFTASYVARADAAATTARAGALTAFNQLVRVRAPEDANRHWLLLPFEWSLHGYSGVIRILWDSACKNPVKIVVNLQNGVAKKLFMVYYEQKQVARIAFAFEPAPAQSARAKLAGRLSQTVRRCTGLSVPVVYAEDAL